MGSAPRCLLGTTRPGTKRLTDWFLIRSGTADIHSPQNARYVVQEGARQQDSDWDPEKEGGFAIFDTEAPSAAEAPIDAFNHLEKTTEQRKTFTTKTERLTQLYNESARSGEDPYTVSRALRHRFREKKKQDERQEEADEAITSRLGLNVKLLSQDAEEGKREWGRIQGLAFDKAKGERKELLNPRSPADLPAVLAKNTTKRAMSLFDPEPSGSLSSTRNKAMILPKATTITKHKVLGKPMRRISGPSTASSSARLQTKHPTAPAICGIVAYDSDDNQ